MIGASVLVAPALADNETVCVQGYFPKDLWLSLWNQSDILDARSALVVFPCACAVAGSMAQALAWPACSLAYSVSARLDARFGLCLARGGRSAARGAPPGTTTPWSATACAHMRPHAP